jgi:hypothetical protein
VIDGIGLLSVPMLLNSAVTIDLGHRAPDAEPLRMKPRVHSGKRRWGYDPDYYRTTTCSLLGTEQPASRVSLRLSHRGSDQVSPVHAVRQLS